MSAKIHVVGMFTDTKQFDKAVIVNTTSAADKDWQTDLSPFYLGPCNLYGDHKARRMENAWQYTKLYACLARPDGSPSEDYWRWAKVGWEDSIARRYPMGKGAKPQCAIWEGERLGYIDARKRIYAPLYAEAVTRTKGWQHLKEIYENEKVLVLRDYDGYEYDKKGMTLSQVLNLPSKKMGHAFVLAMLLTGDFALTELKMRSSK
jgi:hypothetical protein